ncbi:RING/FYVE/PHD zinc finger superfamily protein [Tasmannia lanceolata]|uniref:RING/FYVE/PHD zinc finger superfamily protein n=1 Tax=Tasmannia lanceolata TaxID=3420 RepID=UPI00406453FD
MKGRSHRLPISDPPDDWGDGSWTVDCSCGVNFDDGEEMVNCDECGVWVHTRCSRFVKGETSFTCDKCKSKKNRIENEETEVAQLLVELPTKTLRMDNPYPPSAPPRTSFRLWTDVPIEERVHVQGVPGGDPSLFQGLSSVFTSELWKCAGYVPKKFNFQYREFPCWQEKRVVEVKDEEANENENPVDRGADVLFSLSKEIVPYVAPAETFGGLRGSIEGVSCERMLSPKEMKKRDGGKVLCGGRIQNFVKQERNQLRPVGVHLGKKRKEGSGVSKDWCAKKKARSADKEADNKKRGSTTAIDTLEFHEDRSFKVDGTDFQDLKSGEKRETILSEPNVNGHLEATDNNHEPKNMLLAKSPRVISSDAFGHNFPYEAQVKIENIDQQAASCVGISPITDSLVVSQVKVNEVSVKEEDVKTAVDALNHLDESHNVGNLNGGSSSVAVDSETSKLADGNLRCTALEIPEECMPQDTTGAISLSSFQTNTTVKMELEDPATVNSELSSPVSDSNLDKKTQDVERESDAVNYRDSDSTAEGMVSGSGEPHQSELESGDLVRDSTVHQSSPESRHGSKLGSTNLSPPTPSLRKLVLGVGKSSASTTVRLSKSSVSGSYRPLVTPPSSSAVKPIHSTKQRVKVNPSSDRKKENTADDVPRDESMQEVSRVPTKGHLKSSASSASKTSHSSRISHSLTSKNSLSETKEQVLCSSSKASGAQNLGVPLGSGEPTSLSQSQIASSVGSKPTASGSCQKGEKVNQSSSHPQSKASNHSPSMPPPANVNVSAALSDQELALLLHQELNSSPRVPRVPRMRQAGNMAQLASPTATSMHVKRTSNHGGRDHTLVSRKKNKEETYRDSPRNSRELIDESKRMDRLLSSPDQRRQDPDFTSDGLTKSIRSPDAVTSAKKTTLVASTALANSCPSSSNEANDKNLSSIRGSPRDTSDDDSGAVAASTPRTLPGLIDEIMSKGKRMSYEELCNAVLPHWHNLRKHNGERYAYSSHSQAVLDCLRNRNEWAQLVDRGPKTNSGRKRRKLDADLSLVESENEDAKGRPSKPKDSKSVESHRDDFPKGKRKARKRRRLALQGRGVKEVRRKRKADVVTDDDFGLYSHSSEGTESDDESQGARMGAFGSEASASSSDET